MVFQDGGDLGDLVPSANWGLIGRLTSWPLDRLTKEGTSPSVTDTGLQTLRLMAAMIFDFNVYLKYVKLI
jgi:hypothetical protein